MRDDAWQSRNMGRALAGNHESRGSWLRWVALRGGVVAVTIALWSGCSDGPTAPEQGALRVTTAMTGGDLDEDGYVIVVDNDLREPVVGNGSKVLRNLGTGTHSIALEGVADNCTVSGTQPLSVTISAGTTAEVEFIITCEATGIAVSIATSGPDLPPPYQLQVGELAPRSILSNTTMLIGRLAPGTYTVALTGITDGCVLDGDAQVAVDVTFRSVTPVAFNVTCGILTGVVRVELSTSGTDRDPNGYTLITTGGWQSPAPVNGIVTFQPLPGGTHVVRLVGVASNCTVGDGSERTVTLAVNGATRDTADVQFDVSCERTQKIAYGQGGVIVIAYADGSNAVTVADGYGPSWSPDGTRLVYSAQYCEYYGYWCSGGLEIFDVESGEITTLPNGDGGSEPAWSPDGERIAFVYSAPDGKRSLAVISLVDASPPVFPVASGVLAAAYWPSSPSWSPDGNRIAFGCTVSGSNAFDICAVNVDGTAFQRITHAEGSNFSPAWSPDGSRIVFATTRFSGSSELAWVAPDGSNITHLTSGHSPSWSADGSKIVFSRSNGIFMMNPDGSEVTRLTTGSHFDPVLRP